MVWPIPKTKNAIKIAKKVGYSLAGKIGERVFVELELSYATKLIGKFSDDNIMRTNQHLLLYWKAGFYKSTI